MHKEQYKPGVKVRHQLNKHYGIGRALKLSECDERALVEWPGETHCKPVTAYYRLDLLEVVQDA
ncbi:hypothetical protein DOE73_26435 [Paenibacillus dendritiformis]|nr:hypothetical protein DOE73_26435 [Paenibacillus dendritiformis]